MPDDGSVMPRCVIGDNAQIVAAEQHMAGVVPAQSVPRESCWKIGVCEGLDKMIRRDDGIRGLPDGDYIIRERP